MTNINGIQKMVVGSKDYEQIQKMLGDREGSKVNDEDTLFKTFQYYEMTNCDDNWSVDAQNLSIEDLIKLWKDFDQEETSFAQDFDTFDAYLSTYTKPVDPPPVDPPPVDPPEDEEMVRPYVPTTDLTDADKDRMADFDTMRANNEVAVLNQDGDYALMLEYARQREGTSFLYPSDYNADGTVTDAGKAKEAQMVAKMQELDTGDKTVTKILEDFLSVYDVAEVKGTASNTLGAGNGTINNLATGASKELALGTNKYLITNNGADANELVYEVIDNGSGQNCLQLKGNDWSIQDISTELQADYLQVIGSRNIIDTGSGDDVLRILGDDNKALLGNGNDRIYIEGDNNFTDMWRGDDIMFNVNSDNTVGLGFTGNDRFYTKGDNVTINGEGNTSIGDGAYVDGDTTMHDIENVLTKPDWFPGPDENPPVDPPVDPEKFEITEETVFDFEGVQYEVYKKFSTDASDVLTYHKAEDGRTVFESNGWNITVIGSMNTTGDKNYANVVITGNNNTYFGSNDEDTVEIRGNANNVHGDTSHKVGSNDEITITEGTGNFIYGEEGIDSVISNIEGNFFNKAVIDVENVNGLEQEMPKEEDSSAWKPVTTPTVGQSNQVQLVKDAYNLSPDSKIENVKTKDNQLGMTINGLGYVTTTNKDGNVVSIEQKDKNGTLSKVAYDYDNGELSKAVMTDYVNNTITTTKANGSSSVVTYDDVSLKFPQSTSEIHYSANGEIMYSSVNHDFDNTQTTVTQDGVKTITTYDDIKSTDRNIMNKAVFNPDGSISSNMMYDYTNNTVSTFYPDGTKKVATFGNLSQGSGSDNAAKDIKYYDKDGNLTRTDVYKGGKVDMSFKEGDIYTVDEFFKKADINTNSHISADEVLDIYNKTTDPTLKAVLSNFTDGSSITHAFEIAATASGRDSFEAGNDTIQKGTVDVTTFSQNGIISSDSLAKLQNDAAYSSLVDYEVNNMWFYNGDHNDGVMKPQHPAYALTDNEGKDYHTYTMYLLNTSDSSAYQHHGHIHASNGGQRVDRSDLANIGLTTAADFNNKDYWNQIREASDLVEKLDTFDDSANLEYKITSTGSITPQNMLDMYNECATGKYKDEAWAADMMKLCTDSGVIIVENGIVRVSPDINGTGNINARDLFKKALVSIGYPAEKLA